MMRLFAFTSLTFLWFVGGAAAQSWPTNQQWQSFQCEEEPAFDPYQDHSDEIGHRDVVGEDNSAAGYWFINDTHLFFRLRLDANPLTTEATEFQSGVWGVQLDTDCNRRDYELLLEIDSTISPNMVVLRRNNRPERTNDPNDPANVQVATYITDTHARSQQAQGVLASNIGDDEDFFMDWAIDRDDLVPLGIDSETEVGVVAGISSDSRRLNGDLLCLEGQGQPRFWSEVMMDRFRLDGQDVEDSDDDGLSNCEELHWETDPDNRDSDGDGIEDEDEVNGETDPTDPTNSSAAQGIELRGGGGVTGCSVSAPLSRNSAPTLLGIVLGSWLLVARSRRSSKANKRRRRLNSLQ